MNNVQHPQPLSQRNFVGNSALGVSPLTLGTNVFGWTINPDEAFAVLDAYVEMGGNSIDTADVYSFWGDGNSGGEAEAILGDWLRSRNVIDQLVVSTKAGAAGGRFGSSPDLSEKSLRARLEASLERLRIDRIDLFYLHAEDSRVPVAEIARTLCTFVNEGLVQYTAVSNYSAEAFQALYEAVVAENPQAAPVAMQPRWSLIHRAVETELLPTARTLNADIMPYWGLEKGFLTGKYQNRSLVPTTARQERHRPHELYDARGSRIISALEKVATEINAPVPAIALAWLLHQERVPSVIASARTPEQLTDLAKIGEIKLTAEQLELLAKVSAHDDD